MRASEKRTDCSRLKSAFLNQTEGLKKGQGWSQALYFPFPVTRLGKVGFAGTSTYFVFRGGRREGRRRIVGASYFHLNLTPLSPLEETTRPLPSKEKKEVHFTREPLRGSGEKEGRQARKRKKIEHSRCETFFCFSRVIRASLCVPNFDFILSAFLSCRRRAVAAVLRRRRLHLLAHPSGPGHLRAPDQSHPPLAAPHLRALPQEVALVTVQEGPAQFEAGATNVLRSTDPSPAGVRLCIPVPPSSARRRPLLVPAREPDVRRAVALRHLAHRLAAAARAGVRLQRRINWQAVEGAKVCRERQ